MDELVWEDPPASRRGSRWNNVFHQLSQHPDEWAKIFEGPSRQAYSTAGRLRTQANSIYGEGIIEIISRGIGERGSGQAGVWAIFHSGNDPTIGQMETNVAAIQALVDQVEGGDPAEEVEDEIYEPSGNPFSD